MFDIDVLERDLRIALTLKADDLMFTVGGEAGTRLQAEFLGVDPFDGLAGECFDETNADEIRLSRFEIARQVGELAAAVAERRWGWKTGVPDTEIQRTDNLEFLEHFLSTLPTVALGGLDATSVRNGALRKLYLECLAWFDLVDAVRDVFHDSSDCYSLELSQLALLSGRDLRTIRNHAGPSKLLRTTAERQRRSARKLAPPAFVKVHTFDAVDWLRRRGFEFPPLDLEWGDQRMSRTSRRETIARSLVMLALVNLGPRDVIASRLGWTEDRLRGIEEGAEPLTEKDEERFRDALQL